MINAFKKWLHNWHLSAINKASDREQIRMAESDRRQREQIEVHRAAGQPPKVATTGYVQAALADMNNPHPRPNWRRLQNGTYLVRTQAGMRQAIKNFVGKDGNRKCRFGWPTKYPSVIRISHCYNGVTMLSLPLNDYRKQTQALLDDLAQEDPHAHEPRRELQRDLQEVAGEGDHHA